MEKVGDHTWSHLEALPLPCRAEKWPTNMFANIGLVVGVIGGAEVG